MAEIARRLLFTIIVLVSSRLAADTLKIAVTASFKPVLERMALLFEQTSGHSLILSSASTGTLYQQIKNGAPFDIFLSADDQRPSQLQQLFALPSERVFHYATGELVFVSTDPAIQQLDDLKKSPHRLVIANAAVAPFGVAAEEVLTAINYQGKKVLANNVAQAQQYLNLGLSPVGIVSASVALDLPHVAIDTALYKPIEQTGIVLNSSAAADEFIVFLRSQDVAALYQYYGYLMPQLKP